MELPQAVVERGYWGILSRNRCLSKLYERIDTAVTRLEF